MKGQIDGKGHATGRPGLFGTRTDAHGVGGPDAAALDMERRAALNVDIAGSDIDNTTPYNHADDLEEPTR